LCTLRRLLRALCDNLRTCRWLFGGGGLSPACVGSPFGGVWSWSGGHGRFTFYKEANDASLEDDERPIDAPNDNTSTVAFSENPNTPPTFAASGADRGSVNRDAIGDATHREHRDGIATIAHVPDDEHRSLMKHLEQELAKITPHRSSRHSLSPAERPHAPVHVTRTTWSHEVVR
jgi:hypothetical protein